MLCWTFVSDITIYSYFNFSRPSLVTSKSCCSTLRFISKTTAQKHLPGILFPLLTLFFKYARNCQILSFKSDWWSERAATIAAWSASSLHHSFKSKSKRWSKVHLSGSRAIQSRCKRLASFAVCAQELCKPLKIRYLRTELENPPTKHFGRRNVWQIADPNTPVPHAQGSVHLLWTYSASSLPCRPFFAKLLTIYSTTFNF